MTILQTMQNTEKRIFAAGYQTGRRSDQSLLCNREDWIREMVGPRIPKFKRETRKLAQLLRLIEIPTYFSHNANTPLSAFEVSCTVSVMFDHQRAVRAIVVKAL